MSEALAPISPPERLLCGPGPTNVDPAALAAMREPMLGHLDPDLHGDTFIEDADKLLVALDAEGARADAAGYGDPILLDHRVDDAPADQVRKRFGKAFADALDRMPVGRWQGPVQSGFGAHLVLLERRDPGRAPTLSEVRDDVRREWMHAEQEARNARYYADLRRHYDVRVDMPGDDTEASDAASVAGMTQ